MAFLSYLHVLAQDSVHCALVATAVFAEECQHVGIDTQGNLLLWPRPDYCVLEEVRAEFGRLGKIYVFVAHRVNALPIGP